MSTEIRGFVCRHGRDELSIQIGGRGVEIWINEGKKHCANFNPKDEDIEEIVRALREARRS